MRGIDPGIALENAVATAMRFLVAGLVLGMTSCTASPSASNGCIAYQPAIPLYASLGRVCAVQLTDEWAVSVKHGETVLSDSLAASGRIVDTDYDLVFFPRKAEAPVWRDAVEGEAVFAEGNPPIAGGLVDYLVPLPVPTRERAEGFVVGTGRWCGTRTTPASCGEAILFKITSETKIKPGYSGGPLIGAKDGAVIGMVVAGHEAETPPHATHAAVEKDPNFAGTPAPPADPHLGEAVALPTALIQAEFRRLGL